MIHGAVDGYSRLLLYLKLADNNRAATVLEAFQSATNKFGVPSRVRMDHGTENTEVEHFMIAQRGEGRASVIKGKSVHNQRIERMWLDVFKGVSCVFHRTFFTMEEMEVLTVESDTEMWALHYVYQPRIQQKLDMFVNQWNVHGLSSERGQSPYQLFTAGMLQNINSEHAGVLSFATRTDQPSEEEEPQDDNSEHESEEQPDVDILPTHCPLSQDELTGLREQLDPLDPTDSLGVDVYRRVLQYIQNCNAS